MFKSQIQLEQISNQMSAKWLKNARKKQRKILRECRGDIKAAKRRVASGTAYTEWVLTEQ